MVCFNRILAKLTDKYFLIYSLFRLDVRRMGGIRQSWLHLHSHREVERPRLENRGRIARSRAH